MPPAKELRAELGRLLATGLGVVQTRVGANLNPPCVVVQPGETYIDRSSYCVDLLTYTVLVVAPPGQPDATLDALDDLLDQVRLTLRGTSPKGYRYGFQNVSTPQTIQVGEQSLLAATVAVTTEREH